MIETQRVLGLVAVGGGLTMSGRSVARQRVSLVLVAVTSTTMAAACGAHPTTSPPVTSARASVGPATSSGSVSPAQSAALAAYNGMWADEQAAAASADYQSSLLAQHATGAALSVLVRGLYSYRLRHLVVKGQLVPHPKVASLTPSAAPTQAVVVDCADDTHWLVYKALGGLENAVPGGHRRVTATVTDDGGTWKVSELDAGAEGTC